jgi:rRNA-processing protein FCF1|tara:strand:- start:613 stop:804 length:192 start_codon:yes stop_codon:yes gene_type:complete
VLKPIPDFVVQKLTAIEKMIEVQEKELVTATAANNLEKLPTIQYLIAEYQEMLEETKNYYGVE